MKELKLAQGMGWGVRQSHSPTSTLQSGKRLPPSLHTRGASSKPISHIPQTPVPTGEDV